MFEEFIHKKFVGRKVFSLEGSESLIPLLDLAIEKAGNQGVQEIVMEWRTADPQRARNIIGKRPQQIFLASLHDASDNQDPARRREISLWATARIGKRVPEKKCTFARSIQVIWNL